MKKTTRFVRPIFNFNNSVISNFILDKKKFKSCIVVMTSLYTFEETTKLPAKMTFSNIST